MELELGLSVQQSRRRTWHRLQLSSHGYVGMGSSPKGHCNRIITTTHHRDLLVMFLGQLQVQDNVLELEQK